MRGFTMLEMLTVVAIISVLMTIGAMGIRGITSGKGTSTAMPNCESVFAEARAMAIGKNTNTRVLVDVRDINDRSNYLRRIVIATQQLDDEGNSTDAWILESRGYTLPEGTFFSKQFSKENSSDANAKMKEESYTFVGRQADSGKYVAYEFNSFGNAVKPGASFVIASGARPPGQEPQVTASAKRDFAGFTLWQNGETTVFRDLKAIGDLENVKNF